MSELTVREGDNDAARTGYWIVTGPQDEHDLYAIIERSRITPDNGDAYVGFCWYLHERTQSEFNSAATYMATFARGEAPTLDDALVQLHAAWPAQYRAVDTESVTERMRPLVPRNETHG